MKPQIKLIVRSQPGNSVAGELDHVLEHGACPVGVINYRLGGKISRSVYVFILDKDLLLPLCPSCDWP